MRDDFCLNSVRQALEMFDLGLIKSEQDFNRRRGKTKTSLGKEWYEQSYQVRKVLGMTHEKVSGAVWLEH